MSFEKNEVLLNLLVAEYKDTIFTGINQITYLKIIK
jgi:hypothetical protein